MAKTRTILGGELIEYTKLLDETREQAMDRIISEAVKIGADGIVGLHLTNSMILKNVSELFFYGTAVKLEKKLTAK